MDGPIKTNPFALSKGDLWKIQLRLIKRWRMVLMGLVVLLGALIVALVPGGDPLYELLRLIGWVYIVLGGYFIFGLASYIRIVSSTVSNPMNKTLFIEKTIEFDEDGVTINYANGNTARLLWKNIPKVRFSPQYLEVNVAASQAHHIPYTSFGSREALRSVRELVFRKMSPPLVNGDLPPGVG